MATITSELRVSSVNLTLVTNFYDRLNDLRVPLFAGKRITLPCIVFKLGHLSISRSGSERISRAQTSALGIVKIKTEEDLSRSEPLYLIHPWIDFLLDHQPVGSATETIPQEDMENQSLLFDEPLSLARASDLASAAPQTRTGRLASRFSLSFGRAVTPWRCSISSPPFNSVADGQTDARTPAHRSTETTIRCALAHTEPWERGSVQEGRFGEYDYRSGRGDHPGGIEQAYRERTCIRCALVGYWLHEVRKSDFHT